MLKFHQIAQSVSFDGALRSDKSDLTIVANEFYETKAVREDRFRKLMTGKKFNCQ